MRWSEASRARRAAELEKIGTTTRFVLLDLRDAARNNAALRDELHRCTTDEERELLAFEWFETHAQPTNRSDWLGTRKSSAAVFVGDGNDATFQTPDWPGGRLPPLDSETADLEPPAESPATKRVREPDRLLRTLVAECESQLHERSAVMRAGLRVPRALTFEGISETLADPKFNRERVRHVERLLKLGWPLQKRHPDISADATYVRLPSVDKAASALGLSAAETAARLAEKTIPLT